MNEAEKKAKYLKIARAIYWTITILISLAMLAGGIGMLIGAPQNMEGLVQMGYPTFFGRLLGLFKVLGVVALLFGGRRVIKEWAYAGFTFLLIFASWSHHCAGEGFVKTIAPLVFLALLLISRRQWKTGWM